MISLSGNRDWVADIVAADIAVVVDTAAVGSLVAGIVAAVDTTAVGSPVAGIVVAADTTAVGSPVEDIVAAADNLAGDTRPAALGSRRHFRSP